MVTNGHFLKNNDWLFLNFVTFVKIQVTFWGSRDQLRPKASPSDFAPALSGILPGTEHPPFSESVRSRSFLGDRAVGVSS